ncbi:MAG: hypothetical protein ACRDHH_05745, partial [Actinomycetota bacterium]
MAAASARLSIPVRCPTRRGIAGPVPWPPVSVETCYRHPDRETRVHCTRCGRPICPDCMTQAPVGHHC